VVQLVAPAVGSALFFVAAPGTTAGLVPWLITRWERPDQPFALDVLGSALVLAGLAVVLVCFARFVTEGRGTPAPVAPTEQLVVGGIYRFVRNPMYVGVTAMIGGQALLFNSPATGLWAAVFLATTVTFVTLYEQPKLQEQFGESYERYRKAVPGWWPRVTPYRD
jgi:protein-S-isoprenylcysteine O-methyltransferase Ste14